MVEIWKSNASAYRRLSQQTRFSNFLCPGAPSMCLASEIVQLALCSPFSSIKYFHANSRQPKNDGINAIDRFRIRMHLPFVFAFYVLTLDQSNLRVTWTYFLWFSGSVSSLPHDSLCQFWLQLQLRAQSLPTQRWLNRSENFKFIRSNVRVSIYWWPDSFCMGWRSIQVPLGFVVRGMCSLASSL